jgi:hypothetical protein
MRPALNEERLAVGNVYGEANNMAPCRNLHALISHKNGVRSAIYFLLDIPSFFVPHPSETTGEHRERKSGKVYSKMLFPGGFFLRANNIVMCGNENSRNFQQ